MQSLMNKLAQVFTRSAEPKTEPFVPATDTSKVRNPSTLDRNNPFVYGFPG